MVELLAAKRNDYIALCKWKRHVNTVIPPNITLSVLFGDTLQTTDYDAILVRLTPSPIFFLAIGHG
jgi:hypothetical protein